MLIVPTVGQAQSVDVGGGGTVVGAPSPVGSGGVYTPPPSRSSGGGENVSLINPLKFDCTANGTGNCLESFLSSIMDFVIQIGVVVVILMLVYIGYLFVVAQGSDSKLSEARQALMWTLIGALILLGAKAITSGIMSTVRALGS